MNGQSGTVPQSREKRISIKIWWEMNVDVKKQYTESKMEKTINTLADTLLHKAKAIKERTMLDRIRDDKYVKCVDNKTNPKDDINLLLHKDGNLINTAAEETCSINICSVLRKCKLSLYLRRKMTDFPYY